jgi:hypothetical protein
MSIKRVDCRNCKYYYITWDIYFPYGCKLFGVKSKQLPSAIVYQSLGSECDKYDEQGW